jgi:NAD(P)-dependent dehydrogenase (short-subunit alcohol dehydrogenase family)
MVDLVVISGAGRGIGKAVALDLGKRKIHILCISKSENAELTKNEIINNGGTADCLILDISDYRETEKIVKKWIDSHPFKKIGVVLAASMLGPKGNFLDCNLSEWERCLDTNLIGNLAILKGLLPRMIENKFGRIVFFAGGGSAYAYPLFKAYSASKTVVVRTVENLHYDLIEEGNFAIISLAPGAVDTDMLSAVREAGAEIKTIVNISEPVFFVREFIESRQCNFSGSFVHVRDNWKEYLNSNNQLSHGSIWKLRRIE